MADSDTEVVEQVLPLDVLLGRGKLVHFHPGNVEYRNHVKARASEYARGKGMQRDFIARHVIKFVHDRGGRFMRPIDGGSQWTQCSSSMALSKVKQALRDMVKLKVPVEDTGDRGLAESAGEKTGGRESTPHVRPRKKKACARRKTTETETSEQSHLFGGERSASIPTSVVSSIFAPSVAVIPHQPPNIVGTIAGAMHDASAVLPAGLLPMSNNSMQPAFSNLSSAMSLTQPNWYPMSFGISTATNYPPINLNNQQIDPHMNSFLEQRAALLQQQELQREISNLNSRSSSIPLIEDEILLELLRQQRS